MALKLFLFGIDSAGKTTIFNYLKYGTPQKTLPTLAFNIAALKLTDFDLRIWDAPGQKKLRNYWHRGYSQAQFMMFVLDVSDSERQPEALEEFENVINVSDPKKMPIIFCYNKIDLMSSPAQLESAKKLFEKVLSEITYVYPIETSAYKDDTMHQLKDTIIKVVKERDLKDLPKESDQENDKETDKESDK